MNQSTEHATKAQLKTLVMQLCKDGIFYREAVCEFKREFILAALRSTKGNQFQAARKLGMHRNTLRRNIEKLNIQFAFLRRGGRRPPEGVQGVIHEKKASGHR